ncbi:MAG: carboxylesterase family protein [Anaerolineaceae bacterium]|nr:carboxylesterase family protein [Anaerolineaceae bacterium]
MALLTAICESGELQGTYSGNPEITVFRGIPYAAAPVGPLRWQPPQPAMPWEGVLKADTFRDIPVQVEERHPFYSREFYRCRKPMSEDCLFLNIWTPAEKKEEKLPVMFFIHGGGYKSGYSHEITMDGDAMGKAGVILVTIEYRLGSLGYLSHPALRSHVNGSCGNYGLLDQIAALKWVRRNIAEFGGNPDNITIFGQSAGAMSVLNLVTSPLCEGDIAKAIMESAGGYTGRNNGLLAMKDQNAAENDGILFLEFLGCSDIDEAKKIPAEKLVELERVFIEEVHPEIAFCPIIDGYSQIASTAERVKNFEYADIPYMLGTTDCENGAHLSIPAEPEASFTKRIHDWMGKDAEKFLALTGFERDPETAIRNGGWDDLLKPPVFAWADHALIKPDRKPNYMYYFDRKMPGDGAGAYHSAELWYVFQTLSRCWRPLTGVDFDLSQAMVSYWTNFAKSGDPNEDGLPQWTPYTASNRRVMELGEKIGMTGFCGTPRVRFIVEKILEGD